MRNLDITTLRSFMAVADNGGVTKAAGFLNLTQSAVSMQLKRLEETLGVDLLDRSGRGVALTAAGDQLLGYARRMVALNDEVVGRLSDDAFEGEIHLGVPHDIVYPAIPKVLQRFNAAYPRVKVQLSASHTQILKQQFARGECDIILTTEPDRCADGETLKSLPLVWVGAPGGAAWRQRPLNLALGQHCSFRPLALRALEAADVDWNMAVDTTSDRTIEATVAADLAIHAVLDGTQPPHLEVIDHGGDLPALPAQFINCYGGQARQDEVHQTLLSLLRQAFVERPVAALRLKSA